MIGIGFVLEVSGHDADDCFFMIGHCFVMEHAWPVEGGDVACRKQVPRGGNLTLPCGMVLPALTIIPLDDTLDVALRQLWWFCSCCCGRLQSL